jgi:hypothetical protein
LDFLRRIEPYQGLTPTPGPFFFFAPLPASKTPTRRERRLFVLGCLSFLLSSFQFLRSHEASEGLAPFSIANAWTSFAPT